nr:TNF receptor-associated factor 3 isoform X2 [Hydra vulgaris]
MPLESRTGPEGQSSRKILSSNEEASKIVEKSEDMMETLKYCKFSKIGCKFTGNRFEVDLHMDIASEKHLDYVLKSIQEIKSEYIKKENKVIAKHDSKLKVLQEYICKQNNAIKDLHETNRQLETSARDFEVQLTSISASNSKLIDEMNRLKIQLITLQEELLEHKDINFTGCLMWKITEVSVHITNAVKKQNLSIYSKPFYTSRYGYKIRAQLFLNGLGCNTGQYASIYFHLLPTDHDNILSWPFRHKISFSLLDQSGDKTKNISYALCPSVDDKQFKQPSVNMSEGKGFNKFFSIEELKRDNYVKQDCAYIKIRIHCKTSSSN